MTRKQMSRTGLSQGAALMALMAAGLVALPQAASAEVLWGRQTGLGKFETKKVTLNRTVTITAVTLENTNHFCIWSGAYPAMVMCGTGNDLVGTTLPADRGYFLIPEKPTENTPVYGQVTVE